MTTLKTILAGPLAPDHVADLSNNLVVVLHQIYNANALTTADENTLHKFRVRVSAFLKSNDSRQRWCGAFLALAAAQNSWECLKNHGATWLGMLVHILELPEAPATWEMALRASAEMLTLVSQKPELTREIATSRIAPFSKAALAILESPECSAATAAVFVTELQRVNVAHPVGFRPHSKRFQTALIKLIATSPDSKLVEKACDALTVAHYSASNFGEAAEWREGCISTISDIHSAINALLEGRTDDALASVEQTKSWGFEAKSGSSPADIYASAKAIENLYILLTAFVSQPTAVPVKIPMGRIIPLFNRATSLAQIHFKAHVPQVEQNLVRSTFERINIAAMQSLAALIETVGSNISAYVEDLLETVDMIPADNSAVTLAALELLTTIFNNVGYIAAGSAVQEYVEKAVSKALVLITPGTNVSQASQTEIPDYIARSHLFESPISQKTQQTVYTFLEATMLVCDLSGRCRGLIDRTLLLSKHAARRSAAITSALNPSMASKHSILAMVQQQYPRDASISQFVHPRLPPLTTERRFLPVSASLGEEEELDEDMEIEVEQEEKINDTKSVPFSSTEDTFPAATSTAYREPVVVDAPFKARPETVIAEPVQAIERPAEIAAPTTEFEEIEEEEVAENQVGEDSDEEMGSDFEMPALDVGDSDDDE
ncbi:Pre-rRNA-processing protein [Yarrowia sp. C11]|nr:Pre-rRNA-processing protein [Yarrowia sp. C11]KAG5364172.1 Pre-rRNA-processing protein [Yarrowia sp. E02]